MNSSIMTFGEFLTKIMKRKNVNVSELTRLTNTKSRNTINRILKDRSNIKTINKFKNQLVTIDPLCLSPSELDEMNKSVETSYWGKDLIHSRKVLYDIFNKKNLSTIPIKIKSYGNTGKFPTSKELLNSYNGYKSLNVLIFDACFKDLTDDFAKIIQMSNDIDITINHIINMNNCIKKNADIFSAVHNLINYKQYTAYYNSSYLNQHNSSNSDNVFSNFIVVEKTSHDGTVKNRYHQILSNNTTYNTNRQSWE